MVVHMMHNVLLGPTEDLSRQHSGGTSLATMDKNEHGGSAMQCSDGRPTEDAEEVFKRVTRSSTKRAKNNSSATTTAAATERDKQDKSVMVTFLLDGSGSVTEEDFATMVAFMRKAVTIIHREAKGSAAKFAVIQFSNEVKVEMPLKALSAAAFTTATKRMHRMNGGTNIALALAEARRIAKVDLANENEASSEVCGGQSSVPHAVILITDGRVDAYQAREAVLRAKHFAEEFTNVTFFAFGVGRSVDRRELLRIVRTTCIPQAGSASPAGSSDSHSMHVVHHNQAIGYDSPWTSEDIGAFSPRLSTSSSSSLSSVPAALSVETMAEERFMALRILDDSPW